MWEVKHPAQDPRKAASGISWLPQALCFLGNTSQLLNPPGREMLPLFSSTGEAPALGEQLYSCLVPAVTEHTLC